MRSLYRFLENQFALTGLEVLKELNRKRFHQLTDRQQRLIRNRTIRCIVISEDSDPDIRFDVFERLNTGSVALTAQELRNSVYRGDFNRLLREIAVEPRFTRCLAGRTDSRMTFEELALRFFALDERLLSYRPSLKRFLNDYMRDHRYLDDSALEAKREHFLEAADRAHAIFGDECFRRAASVNGEWTWLPLVNSAVYDVVMLNLSRLEVSASELARRSQPIEQMTAELTLENEEFADAISRATGDRTRLRLRVRIYAEHLAKLGFDSGLAERLHD